MSPKPTFTFAFVPLPKKTRALKYPRDDELTEQAIQLMKSLPKPSKSRIVTSLTKNIELGLNEDINSMNRRLIRRINIKLRNAF